MRLPDNVHEGIEPCTDILGRRIRKGVENNGVHFHIGQHMREIFLQFAVAAETHIHTVQTQFPAQSGRPGGSRPGSRGTVGDAGALHHNLVPEGIRHRFDARTFLNRKFHLVQMVKGRQIHDALLLPFRHIADQRRFVLIGQAARSHRTGKDPVTVPLDIQVKSAGHRRRHVGMTAKTANLPTYADAARIGLETHRQAGGHFGLPGT